MQKRPVFKTLLQRLEKPRSFIQVLLGPRQVGKTTLAKQVCQALAKPTHYVSADLAVLQDLSWLEQQWALARQKAKTTPQGAVLIIDEVQKIPHWSELIKALWDADTWTECPLSVLILGSSPWLMQKGLTESLAGRFEILPMTHWSFAEMEQVFSWSLDQYLYFGGYPGAATLADPQDVTQWSNYVNDALIETTVSRDILLMTQINKPVLLRRVFQLACSYSAQMLSYSKMLGELQDAGNTTTIAHYLDLLSGVGLVAGLKKYAQQSVRQKSSSPKFCVFNTALMTAQLSSAYEEAKQNPVLWGRITESAVGAYLLNAIRGTPAELFYWREGDKEVDFVLKYGEKVIAIEVKSNSAGLQHSGLDAFNKAFKPSKILLVGQAGLPVSDFLKMSVKEMVD